MILLHRASTTIRVTVAEAIKVDEGVINGLGDTRITKNTEFYTALKAYLYQKTCAEYVLLARKTIEGGYFARLQKVLIDALAVLDFCVACFRVAYLNGNHRTAGVDSVRIGEVLSLRIRLNSALRYVSQEKRSVMSKAVAQSRALADQAKESMNKITY